MIRNLYRLFTAPGGKTRDEIEFLPAALEIIEMPPNPTGRKILWSILFLFVFLVVWSMVSEIDIVAVAHGKIIPIGQTKTIQPIETSTVKAIHVSEDEYVQKGQLLIELDNINYKSDVIRLNEERRARVSDMVRIDKLLEKLQAEEANVEIVDAKKHQVTGEDLQKARIENEYQHIQAQLQSIEEKINKGKAEYNLTLGMISKLNKTVPLVSERAHIYENAVSDGNVSRNHWLQIEQERIEQDEELKILHTRLQAINASTEVSRQEHKSLQKQIIASLLEQREEASIELSALNQEIIKTEAFYLRQRIKAPVSGVVQQLSVHTVGGVVTTAQQLMRIVPANNQLEIEAFFSNRDIGFLKEGQSAQVKIDAFPFTRYGTVAASLGSLSNDAVFDEHKGLVYAARVRIDQDEVREKNLTLSPGMSVTVEVSTGTRILIDYFLSPFLEYRHESIRER